VSLGGAAARPSEREESEREAEDPR